MHSTNSIKTGFVINVAGFRTHFGCAGGNIRPTITKIIKAIDVNNFCLSLENKKEAKIK